MKRIAYLFAALGTVLLGSCASMTTEGEHGGQTMPWASPEGFEAYINLQGEVTSENISYVAPRNGVGGYVKELYIKEGQAVKKGQLILKLDDQILRQSIEATKTQLAFAEDLYNRTKTLWDQKIGTEVQLLSAKNNVDGLKNQISIQEEQLKTYLVYADQSGIAEVVNIKTGELFAGMGPFGPQIQIVNNNDLSIIFLHHRFDSTTTTTTIHSQYKYCIRYYCKNKNTTTDVLGNCNKQPQ